MNAQYRVALGLNEGAALPSRIGTGAATSAAAGSSSASGATSKRAASARRAPGDGRADKRTVEQLGLTGQQVRLVACPRCLAKPDAPCRDSKGRVYGRGHAERHRAAAHHPRVRRQMPRNRRPDPVPTPRAPMSEQNRAQYLAEQQRRSAATGAPTSTGRGLDPMADAFAVRRGKVVDNGDGLPRQMPSKFTP
ncbi:hypothetical protein AB0J52_03750 [Spirillospora sp. NPDC049652]